MEDVYPSSKRKNAFDIFQKEVICFTGKSIFIRSHMEKLAIQHGAEITKTVNRHTTLLVIGNRPGCKLERALMSGIKIIADDAFFNVLKLKQTKIHSNT